MCFECRVGLCAEAGFRRDRIVHFEGVGSGQVVASVHQVGRCDSVFCARPLKEQSEHKATRETTHVRHHASHQKRA